LLNDLGGEVVNVIVKFRDGLCGVCHVFGHGEDGLQQNLGLIMERSCSLGVTSQRIRNLLGTVSVNINVGDLDDSLGSVDPEPSRLPMSYHETDLSGRQCPEHG
jgi:hypothetical protein